MAGVRNKQMSETKETVCDKTEGGEKRSLLELRTDSGGGLAIKSVNLSTLCFFQLMHTFVLLYL